MSAPTGQVTGSTKSFMDNYNCSKITDFGYTCENWEKRFRFNGANRMEFPEIVKECHKTYAPIKLRVTIEVIEDARNDKS